MSRFSLQICTIIMYHYRNNNGLLRVWIMFRLASGRVIMALNYVHVGLRCDALCLLKVMLLHFTLAWWAANSTSFPFSEPCLSLLGEGILIYVTAENPPGDLASCPLHLMQSSDCFLPCFISRRRRQFCARKLRTKGLLLSSDLSDRSIVYYDPLRNPLSCLICILLM